MHRSYQPVKPTCNLYLQYRWDNDVTKYWNHKFEIAKHGIDNQAPRIHQHILEKLKKKQIESERQTEVDRDNRMLRNKMEYIMAHGGRVDNVKHDYCKKSLHKEQLLREMARVAKDNMAIMRRMEEREPLLNIIKGKYDFKTNRDYYINITRYPFNLRPTLQRRLLERQNHANTKSRERVKAGAKPVDSKDSSIPPLAKVSSIVQYDWKRKDSRRASVNRDHLMEQLQSSYAKTLQDIFGIN